MNARDEAKARVRAKVAAEKALPTSEQLMTTLHATRTTADSKALLAAFRSEVLAEAAAELESYCPYHGDKKTAYLACPCEYADDLRRMAGKGGAK